MKKIALVKINRHYANNGQHAEQTFRFTITGRMERADNKPASFGGDCGDIQIKSARATICKGLDLEKALANDGANQWAYVTADFEKAYLMNKAEYIAFVNEFGTVTKDSDKNGGALKIRLKSEGRKMLEWLSAKA